MTTKPLSASTAGRNHLAVGLAAVLTLLLFSCSTESTEGEQADLNQQLIVAAWDNDLERARDLIADGADVNHKDGSQQSAYLIATSEGYLELLELTLDNGADVTSLDSFNGTGLIRAAERGHADVVERLLETDIDVNHINNLGWTALHEAIILGDGGDRYVRTIQLLLDHGADPNLPTQADGHSPLTLAEGRDQTAVVALLRSTQ
ncbi:MAG: ankyrin repeat domain-containing protein [Acidimicrobiia bacterium]|nr:ankyrin repeat domain-containing protein [Acidimicrobiia bacterium]